MLGVRAGKSCAIAGNFVGDPAASRHALKKNNHQGDEDTRRKALQKFLRVPLCFVPLVIKWLRRGSLKISLTLPSKVRCSGLFSTFVYPSSSCNNSRCRLV